MNDTEGRKTRRAARWAGVAMMMAVALVASACSAKAPAKAASASAEKAKTREVTLVTYSVTKKAYEKILPLFAADWKAKTGEEVAFKTSFGASGTQSRAVIDGLEADVVHLAMEPDVDKISKSGLIAEGWQERAPGGKAVPTTSLIVLGVRSGNPKGIAGWADASKEGIGVVTPDPKSSGGARWNLLGSWGSVAFNGGDEKQAYDQVKKLYGNTLVLDKSARDATNTFLKKGIGDVAVLWESDALLAKDEGGEFDIVYPESTILAETAASVVDGVVDKKGTREVSQAFVEFLFTPAAQAEFAKAGLRPSVTDVEKRFAERYPQPSGKLFRIADFGGWKDAGEKYFGDAGIYSKIEAEVASKKK